MIDIPLWCQIKSMLFERKNFTICNCNITILYVRGIDVLLIYYYVIYPDLKQSPDSGLKRRMS